MSSFVSAQETLYVAANLVSNQQESELNGNYFIIPCKLCNHDINIDPHALVDCCCT
jgi:hypothetical protein